MTIKPIISSKSSEKKENHGHNNHQESQQQTTSRSTRNKSSVEVQSSHSQLRNDVYEDITRHRRSPHKTPGRSKREHHLKRNEQRDREKICSSSPSYQSHSNHTNCNSPLIATGTSGNKSTKNVVSTVSSLTQQQQQTKGEEEEEENTLQEEYAGYNSGDEHLVPGESLLTPDEWKNRDEQFVKVMSERGFVIQDIIEDGACLFRAISLQIYGDQEMHEIIRQQTMDYIYENREYYAHFVTEDINSYVQRKRSKDSHGNHIEIQAISEIYNRPIELYCYETTPINIFNSEQRYNNGYDPLRLSYQRGSHYNAILDPYNASVGVGLGLAGYKPESQTHEAIRLSEQLEIEKTMFEDKLKTTDWEATNEAIEEQIARESYLQWCRENLQKVRNSCTSSTVTSAEAQINNNNNNINNNNNNANNINNINNINIFESTSTSSTSIDTLQQFHNNNNNNNNNNVNVNVNSNNSDLNCDREKISDQSTSMLSKLSLKKKDVKDGNCSSVCASGNSNSTSINNKESNSPCDSDDTDMSSTSSVEIGGKHYRLKSTSNKQSTSKLPRRIKRRHKDCELKRTSSAVIDKRLKLSQNVQQQQQSKNEQNLEYNNKSSFNFQTNNNNYLQQANMSANPAIACTSKQAKADSKPISQFYQSLLESTYTEDGMGQLSEGEMLQRALKMSRMDFIEEQKRKFSKLCHGKRNDDEDSDTLST